MSERKIDGMYIGKIEDDFLGPKITTYDILMGRVRSQWCDESKRSRFIIAKRLSFGPNFESVEKWKEFLEVYLAQAEEMGEPKTMNKLIKVMRAAETEWANRNKVKRVKQ